VNVNKDQTATRITVGTLAIGALCAAFLFGGGWGLWQGITAAENAIASTRWPSAPGVITVSKVTHYESHDPDSIDTMYEADITYEYQVAGRKLDGHTASFADISSSDPRPAEAIVGRYPVGAAVTVYYDPAQPETSALEPGLAGGLILPLGIGASFTLIGLGLAWLLVRMTRAGLD
jgi:hypothetical protein